MKVNKSSLIAVGLVTGVSVGLLSGCGRLSSFNKEPIVNPSPTLSPASRVSEQDILKKKLQAVQGKLDELKSFTDGITVKPDGTIEMSINYTEAQQKVEDIANAYKSFKELPQTVKLKLKIADFNKVDESIEKLLGENSPTRLILTNLADKNFEEAQTQLSQFKIENEPIYDPTKKNGQDLSRQKIATKKLLTYTLETLKPKIKTLMTEISALSPTGGSSTISQGSENAVQHNASSGGNSVDYGWLLPLLNTTTLLVVIAILLLLFNKNKTDRIVLKDKNLNEEYNSERKAESPKLIEEISEVNCTIVGLKHNLNYLKLFNPFRKDRLARQDITTTIEKLEEIKIKLEELKNINMDEISVSSKVNPSGDVEFSSHLGNDEVEQASLDVKFGEFQFTIDKTLRELDEKLNSFTNDIRGLIVSTGQDDSSKIETASMFNDIKTMLDNITSEIQASKTQTISFSPKVENQLKAIRSITGTMANNQKGLQDCLNKTNAIQNQLEEKIKHINSGSVHSDFDQLNKEKQEWESKYNVVKDQFEALTIEVSSRNISFEKSLEEKTCLLSEANGEVVRLNDQITQLEANKLLLEEKIKSLEEKIKRGEKHQSHEGTHIPTQWQNLIEAYQQSPENIVQYSQQIQRVIEDEDKFMERYENSNKPVILKSADSSDGYYILNLEGEYLLFPRQKAIPFSQKDTAAALFDGYKGGNVNRFTLILPAQVTSLGNGMWQLKQKGRLEYS